MKDNFSLLIMNLPATISSLAAGFLAYNSVEGWGWFLVVAVLTAVVGKTS